MEANNEVNAELDTTVSALQGGVERLGIRAALPVIEGWERRLADSGRPELAPVAENLGALRTQLSGGDPDQAEVGRIMSELGDQVQSVANEDVHIEITDKLSQLSAMLTTEGDSLADQQS